MTPGEVTALVSALDGTIETIQRPDGGWLLSTGGIRVGVAPNPHSEALRRCLEDGVKAIGLMAGAKPEIAPDGDAWRATIERRLSVLERVTPRTGRKR